MLAQPDDDRGVTRFDAGPIGVTLTSQDNVNVTRILGGGIHVTPERRRAGDRRRQLTSPSPLIYAEA